MAIVNLGSIKFNWKGAYSGATAYVVDDVVESSGSSYICIAATTGNAPPNATYWEQMSSAGTNGTDGTDLGTTLTTQGDIVYRDASGLARLGAGTSGQALITNGTGANPSWGDVSGGVIQTKMAMDGDRYAISTAVVPGGTVTSCYEVSALTLTLTPSSASSKFLIDLNLMANHESGYMAGGYLTYQVSGGTEYAITSDGSRGITFRFDEIVANSDMGQGTTNPMVMIAPNTTSAITFRCRVFIASSNSQPLYINRTPNNNTDQDDGGFTLSSMMVTEFDGGVSTITSQNIDLLNT